jgi:hypothetical protein
MEESYREASALNEKGAGEKKGRTDPYPLLNRATAEVLLNLSRRSRQKAPNLKAILLNAREAAAERDRRQPNFWDAVTAADCLLIEYLASRDLPRRVEEIVSAYQEARRRDASPREFRWVIEYLEFLKAAIGLAIDKDRGVSFALALAEIQARLTGSAAKV